MQEDYARREGLLLDMDQHQANYAMREEELQRRIETYTSQLEASQGDHQALETHQRELVAQRQRMERELARAELQSDGALRRAGFRDLRQHTWRLAKGRTAMLVERWRTNWRREAVEDRAAQWEEQQLLVVESHAGVKRASIQLMRDAPWRLVRGKLSTMIGVWWSNRRQSLGDEAERLKARLQGEVIAVRSELTQAGMESGKYKARLEAEVNARRHLTLVTQIALTVASIAKGRQVAAFYGMRLEYARATAEHRLVVMRYTDEDGFKSAGARCMRAAFWRLAKGQLGLCIELWRASASAELRIATSAMSASLEAEFAAENRTASLRRVCLVLAFRERGVVGQVAHSMRMNHSDVKRGQDLRRMEASNALSLQHAAVRDMRAILMHAERGQRAMLVHTWRLNQECALEKLTAGAKVRIEAQLQVRGASVHLMAVVLARILRGELGSALLAIRLNRAEESSRELMRHMQMESERAVQYAGVRDLRACLWRIDKGIAAMRLGRWRDNAKATVLLAVTQEKAWLSAEMTAASRGSAIAMLSRVLARLTLVPAARAFQGMRLCRTIELGERKLQRMQGQSEAELRHASVRAMRAVLIRLEKSSTTCCLEAWRAQKKWSAMQATTQAQVRLEAEFRLTGQVGALRRISLVIATLLHGRFGRIFEALRMNIAGEAREQEMRQMVAEHTAELRHASVRDLRAALRRLEKGETSMRVELWRSNTKVAMIRQTDREQASLRNSMVLRGSRAGIRRIGNILATRWHGDLGRALQSIKMSRMQDEINLEIIRMQLRGEVQLRHAAVRDMGALLIRLEKGTIASRLAVWRDNRKLELMLNADAITARLELDMRKQGHAAAVYQTALVLANGLRGQRAACFFAMRAAHHRSILTQAHQNHKLSRQDADELRRLLHATQVELTQRRIEAKELNARLASMLETKRLADDFTSQSTAAAERSRVHDALQMIEEVEQSLKLEALQKRVELETAAADGMLSKSRGFVFHVLAGMFRRAIEATKYHAVRWWRANLIAESLSYEKYKKQEIKGKMLEKSVQFLVQELADKNDALRASWEVTEGVDKPHTAEANPPLSLASTARDDVGSGGPSSPRLTDAKALETTSRVEAFPELLQQNLSAMAVEQETAMIRALQKLIETNDQPGPVVQMPPRLPEPEDETALAELRSMVRQLEEGLATKGIEMEEGMQYVLEKLENKNKEVARLETHADLLDRRLEEQSTAITEEIAASDALYDELTSTKRIVIELKDRVGRSEQDAAGLLDDCNETQQEVRRSESIKTQLQREVEESKAALATLTDSEAQLRAKLQRSDSAFQADLDAKATRLQEQEEASRAAQSGLEQKLATRERQLAERTQELELLQEQKTKLHGRETELRRGLAEREVELSEVRAALYSVEQRREEELHASLQEASRRVAEEANAGTSGLEDEEATRRAAALAAHTGLKQLLAERDAKVKQLEGTLQQTQDKLDHRDASLVESTALASELREQGAKLGQCLVSKEAETDAAMKAITEAWESELLEMDARLQDRGEELEREKARSTAANEARQRAVSEHEVAWARREAEFRREKDAMEDALHGLETEFRTRSEEAGEFRAQLKSKAEQIVELHEAREIDRAHARLVQETAEKRLREKCVEMSHAVSLQTDDAALAKKKVDSKERQLEEAARGWERAITTHEVEAEQLQLQVASLEKKLKLEQEAHTATLSTHVSEQEKLRRHTNATAKKYLAKELELSGAVEAREERIHRLDAKLAGVESILREKDDELDAFAVAVNQEKLQQRRTEHSLKDQLVQKAEAIAAANTASEATHAKASSHIAQLEQCLHGEAHQVELAKQRSEDLERQRQGLEKALAERDAEIAKTVKTLLVLEGKLDTAEVEIAHGSRQLQQSEASFQDATREARISAEIVQEENAHRVKLLEERLSAQTLEWHDTRVKLQGEAHAKDEARKKELIELERDAAADHTRLVEEGQRRGEEWQARVHAKEQERDTMAEYERGKASKASEAYEERLRLLERQLRDDSEQHRTDTWHRNEAHKRKLKEQAEAADGALGEERQSKAAAQEATAVEKRSCQAEHVKALRQLENRLVEESSAAEATLLGSQQGGQAKLAEANQVIVHLRGLVAQSEGAVMKREEELGRATRGLAKLEKDVEVQRLEQRLHEDAEKARYKEAVVDSNLAVIDQMKALLEERDNEVAEMCSMLQASNEQADLKAKHYLALTRDNDDLVAKASVLETACSFWRKERLQRPLGSSPKQQPCGRRAVSPNAERHRSTKLEQLYAERERLAGLCATLDPVAFRDEAVETMAQLAKLERELVADRGP